MLSALADALYSCIGAIPSQVKRESGPTLTGTTFSAMYYAFADDVTGLWMRNAEIDEVDKEFNGYKTVTGAKINRNKSIGLWLCV